MKFAICNEIFQGWPIGATIPYVAQTGYDALEIAPFTLGKLVTDIPKAERQRVRQLAEQHRLAISGIHWVLVQAEGMYVTHPEKTVRDRTAQYFCDLVDFCRDLGGSTIVVGSPKQRNIMDGVTPEQAWEWARETFTPSVKRAADAGVTICLEPLAPSETNFINTAADAISFVKQFTSSSFKIILDVKAMSS